jgi:dihydroneopterin aldolase
MCADAMLNPDLVNLVPADLRPRTLKIALTGYELPVDIGFHMFEVGAPQRLRVSVEVWLDPASLPAEDHADHAWDYDFLRQEIARLATARRWNLQETFARAVYDMVAARDGVTALRVRTAKPDVYPDCEAVGLELASF